MEKEVKHSIFVRNVYAKRYEVQTECTHLGWQQHISYSLYPISNFIKTEIVKEIDISIPLLSKGEKFHLLDVDEIVTVKDVVRRSDNCITYIVEDKYIDDKISEVSMKQARNIIYNLDLLDKIKSKWWYRFFSKFYKELR